jgi:putative transposase
VKDQEKKRIDDIALFRFGVLGDLVHASPGERAVADQLAEKASREYQIPYSARSRVAGETIRDWLKAYRRGGFEALKPKPRADAGTSRAIPQAIADALLGIKEDHPNWSVRLVIAHAEAEGLIPACAAVKPTTVHRLLAHHGLMEKPRTSENADRRRFAFQKAGQLWMSDVMYGPAVLVGKQKRKTYLIAFIDDATRVVPFAEFALSENTAAFLPVFKQAVQRRGIPQRLFVDNGSAYRSRHLSLVCARLGVTLIHARPYDAAAKGKQERWFRRVRTQLLPILTEPDLASLETLNRRLRAWIETEYHQSPHKGLDGQTPLDRWAQVGDEVRSAEGDLEELFLAESQRKVQKDRVISLNGMAYEADASLVGEKVTLRFDPSKPGRAIQVIHNGKVWTARLVDVYQNCFVKRDRSSQSLTVVSPPAAAERAEPAAPPERPLSPQRLRLSELPRKEER